MDASSKLNELDHYPSLLERSKRIGYSVTKVVFRGYQASDKLQVSSTGADHPPAHTSLNEAGRSGDEALNSCVWLIVSSAPSQRLHDKAIEKRAGLKAKKEAEQQKQDLTDSKLLNEQQRSVLRT